MTSRHSCFCAAILAGLLFPGALATAAESLPWELVETLPHPLGAFTQGLEFDGAEIVESSGYYGRSFISRWRPGADTALQQRRLPDDIFAEGLTFHAGRLFVLSWRAGRAFEFDPGFNPIAEHSYRGEGWGLCSDGRELVMSDGSATLRFFDPADFSERRTLGVHRDGKSVGRLNELECLPGALLANVWHSGRVLLIDADSGAVTAQLDFSSLGPKRRCHECVLNGLAWDADSGTLLVTGKRWPHVYRVRAPALKALQH